MPPSRSSSKSARVCIIPERQLRDHRRHWIHCKNHTHYSVARVKNDVALGEMIFLDKNGNQTPAQTSVATFTSKAAGTWQKTRSGPVCTMQMIIGEKGRHVPLMQHDLEQAPA